MPTSDYVRRVRKLLDLNQTEFAERIGVSRKTIERYENGELIPRRSLMAIQKLEADHNKESKK